MGHLRGTLWVSALVLAAGCAPRGSGPELPPAPPARQELPSIDYTIQVGAFARPENAARLVASLEVAGVEAFHFAGDDGLHRVRFGSFVSRELATRHARGLRDGHVIGEYHVVAAGAEPGGRDESGRRAEIVRAAMRFLGRPYRWGGTDGAFDCSGLTMTAYRLNGLGLPRSSAEQYARGESVATPSLREADLVFFATERRGRPSHVGLYIGDGRFIHAPSRGKVVRVDELDADYYRRHFLAARSYLD
jgi:cell wall-associated NlpC family hydrolase